MYLSIDSFSTIPRLIISDISDRWYHSFPAHRYLRKQCNCHESVFHDKKIANLFVAVALVIRNNSRTSRIT